MKKKNAHRVDKQNRKNFDPTKWAKKYLKDKISFIKAPKGSHAVYGVGRFVCNICKRKTNQITVRFTDEGKIETCEDCS